MRIVLASDHAGFEIKEHLREILQASGYEVVDFGAHTFVESDDYPDYVAQVGEAVSQDPKNTRGIIFGASGQGEAIVANRFPRVRAVVYVGEPSSVETTSCEVLVRTREHNDANVLSLGTRYFTPASAEKAVRLWLDTPFSSEERHVRRIQKIESVLSKNDNESYKKQ